MSSSRTQSISWSDVLDLRVVKSLVGIIARRWRLPVGFLGADGRAADGELLCGQPGCPSLETCDLARPNRSLAGLAEPDGLICRAGLRHLACPIWIDGERCGALIAGGFLADGDPAALERAPRLERNEQALLSEILATLAEEIARFQHELGATDRRRAPDPAARTRYSYHEIIGQSRPIVELYHLLDKVIDSDSTVLIQGENGTGKELFARAIHFNSRRKQHRFVVQNCSAFNDNLLDSELFGHKKGAFTGAVSDKQGLFEIADGSTFFLDEIGDMSPSLQVKLLRVLQEGTFIPVGDTQVRQVDVRIIAATNRDLRRMVERGEFREDLYYRINVINLHVPPLRERKDDIPLLVDHFLLKHSRGDRRELRKLSKGCAARLHEYSWPGNIRELENEIERMVVLAGDEKLISEDLLSSRIGQLSPRVGAAEPSCLPDAVEQLERNMIYEVLRRNHWNKTRAAEELRISRRNLIRKVTKYKLDQRREP
jgi:transcriptional regulator with PAS, ATPase and Fis domain